MKKDYLINPENTLIPDAGLGTFVEGFATKRFNFNWLSLFTIVIPFIGPFLFLYFFIYKGFKEWLRIKKFYVFSDGFIWQLSKRNGQLLEEDIVKFEDLEGISISKTRHYKNQGLASLYQDLYDGTSACIRALSKNMEIVFNQTTTYYNKNEKPEKYNMLGFAYNSILEQWNKVALVKAWRDINEHGYCTFYSGNVDVEEIELHRDYIRLKHDDINDDIIEKENIRYTFKEGELHLYSNYGGNFDNDLQGNIDVNSMFNSTVFLLIISELYGIG